MPYRGGAPSENQTFRASGRCRLGTAVGCHLVAKLDPLMSLRCRKSLGLSGGGAALAIETNLYVGLVHGTSASARVRLGARSILDAFCGEARFGGTRELLVGCRFVA
jgi:hypothetical protein